MLNNRKRLFKAVFFALPLALAGCAGGEKLAYEEVRMHRYEEGCDTTQSPVCASVNLSYPVFKDGDAAVAVNATVEKIFFGKDGGTDTLCAGFFRAWKSFREMTEADSLHQAALSPASQEGEDEGCFSLPWYYTAALEVMETTEKYIPLHYQLFSNAPFSVSGMGKKYFTLDAKDGRVLSPDDVFADTLALRRMLTGILFRRLDIQDGVPFVEQGLNLPSDGLLPLSDDFAVGGKGAVFHYDMEAIAPNLMPEGDLLVPVEELEPFLK